MKWERRRATATAAEREVRNTRPSAAFLQLQREDLRAAFTPERTDPMTTAYGRKKATRAERAIERARRYQPVEPVDTTRAAAPALHRKRVNFTLAPATVSKLADTINASRYIDRLVRARDREWRAALAALRAGGFSLAAINAHVNSPDVLGQRGPNAHRFRVLADELDAGNHAVHAALTADEVA